MSQSPSSHALRRQLRRGDASIRNHLRSIARDAAFVNSLRSHERLFELPCFANLRCGGWYAQDPDGGAYFKSTDGHVTAASFSLTRLNLHVAAAASRRGALLVDATRSGKPSPDALARTLPLWCAVVNAVVFGAGHHGDEAPAPVDHVCFPPWIPPSEADAAATRARGIVASLPPALVGTIRSQLVDRLPAPLLPAWVGQLSPDAAAAASSSGGDHPAAQPPFSLHVCERCVSGVREAGTPRATAELLSVLLPAASDGVGDGAPAPGPRWTPLLCVSASLRVDDASRHLAANNAPASRHELGHGDTASAHAGWRYIPGAGDDAEGWARGLTPALFWAHSRALLGSDAFACGTDADCEALVDAIVAQAWSSAASGVAAVSGDEGDEADGPGGLELALVPAFAGDDFAGDEVPSVYVSTQHATAGLLRRFDLRTDRGRGALIGALEAALDGSPCGAIVVEPQAVTVGGATSNVAPRGCEGPVDATGAAPKQQQQPFDSSLHRSALLQLPVPVDKQATRHCDGGRSWEGRILPALGRFVEQHHGRGRGCDEQAPPPPPLVVLSASDAAAPHAVAVAVAARLMLGASGATPAAAAPAGKLAIRVLASQAQAAACVPSVPRDVLQRLNARFCGVPAGPPAGGV